MASPSPDHPGTMVMHDTVFNRGLGHFAAPGFEEPNEKTSNDYPFIMITGRHLFHYNAGTQTRRTPLNEYSSTDYWKSTGDALDWESRWFTGLALQSEKENQDDG
ncbi:MAG: hypothetical protein CM1200mP29_04270 [Verrucomicrobiota bacterium]|nr:MAG: hypothetical protein CM1200mP29_04270 [Verrucomicrobiota bacterium]